MSKGYIYIMSDSEHEDKIKIGKTEKHPEIRAEQMSKQTASIGDFKLQWFEEVSDCHFMESYLHFIFKEFHYKKEFFKIDLGLAIEIANESTLYFKELENKLKDLFLGKVEFIEKRIKALEISNRLAVCDNKKNVLNRLESLITQLEQIKQFSKTK
jgi:hypothetical protein